MNEPKPHPLIPIGEKRNVFKVTRVADNHYTFAQGSSTLDPGHGTIRDRDSVLRVASKLQEMFPKSLPSYVHMGDAVLPGVMPSRTVRTVFSSRGKLLVEGEPLGVQCFKTDFIKNF